MAEAEKKALIAMSGGVDSSVAAFLTREQGFSCIGVTMRLYDGTGEPGTESTCCSLEDVEDARSVAFRLGIPYYVFNFTGEFDRQVIQKFISCYESGLTPNPCIDCNRYLKFAALQHRAAELGCSHVVTGHYARIERCAQTGRFLLRKAADESKDQSYFLYTLTQEQLAHTLFPLGTLRKDEVRQIAEAQGFLNARKRDSQDICFVPDGDYLGFMERYTGISHTAGAFLDTDGNVIGTHRGAAGYTLGQRKGLGVAMGTPVYVCGKDMVKNTVTLGPNEALYHRALLAEDWNWFPFDTPGAPLRVTAKTRSRQTAQDAWVYPLDNGAARVEFDTPQRAIAQGQAVVLYDGDTVVGGGTITQVLPD